MCEPTTSAAYNLSRASFTALWSRLRLHGDPQPVHRALRAAWREPQRLYHRTQHLQHCLQLLERWQQQAQQPDQIALALWFHDAVYQPQAHDNEASSAQWASGMLITARASDHLQQRIDRLIMATAHGSTAATTDDPDRDLLLDIDLAILGAAPADYQRYRWQIRGEYAFVAPADYRRGRSRVLQHFLDQPRIYRTAIGQELEQPARTNLARELALLQ